VHDNDIPRLQPRHHLRRAGSRVVTEYQVLDEFIQQDVLADVEAPAPVQSLGTFVDPVGLSISSRTGPPTSIPSRVSNPATCGNWRSVNARSNSSTTSASNDRSDAHAFVQRLLRIQPI
jgi:hypothetical protein